MDRFEKVVSLILIFGVVLSGIFMILEMSSNLKMEKLDLQEEGINFLTNQLWDPINGGFYYYQLPNGSFTQNGLKKYTAFNIWTVRAFLHYAISRNDSSYFENYGIPTLNFLFNHLFNETNGGFYQWVNPDGTLPPVGDTTFNHSIQQLAVDQAWVLITLAEVYNYTKNSTYINVWNERLANFLINMLWDDVNGGFYAKYMPFYDIILEEYKHTWYQSWPALALMNHYEITGNVTYFNYAHDALTFLIEKLWDNTTKAFRSRCYVNGTPITSPQFLLMDQASIILAFQKYANLTGNYTYWNEYVIPLLNFTKSYLWDMDMGQFTLSYTVGCGCDESAYHPFDLSLWLYSLKIASEILPESQDLLEMRSSSQLHLMKHGWDSQAKGFFTKIHLDGSTLNAEKRTIDQALSIYLFCYVDPAIPVNYLTFYIFLGLFIASIGVLIYVYLKTKKSENLTRRKVALIHHPIVLKISKV